MSEDAPVKKAKAKAKPIVEGLKLKNNHWHAGVLYEAGTPVEDFKNAPSVSDIAKMRSFGVI